MLSESGRKRRRRIAALFEVLGVYMTGAALAIFVVKVLLGAKLPNPLATLSANATDPELIRASGGMFLVLAVQYAFYFILVVPVNWWHRRRGRAAYGITRASRSWTTLLVIGASTAALTSWLVLAVGFAQLRCAAGTTVPWRRALYTMSWDRWQFWLFAAVLLFGVVPVLEELFVRGYCQRRLAEEWGDGAAIAGSSFLFVFSHSQYLILDGYNIGLIAGLLIASFGFGVVFAWTRSLVPSIVAHAILNLPLRALWLAGLLCLFLVVGSKTAKRGISAARLVFSGSSSIAMIGVALTCGGYALASDRIPLPFAAASVGMLVTAVILEAKERRMSAIAST